MKKLKGFTVIEIMIGLAIGLIVVASAGSFIISTLRFNMDNVKQQRFEQVIQILKNTIASGLRRAGFSNSATSLPDVTGWTAGTHYYINGNCALFTYFDTTLAVPKQQFFGYKLDTTTGIIYSYQADTKIDCATTTTWEAMNNPTEIKYSVSALDSFFSSPSNPKLIEIHLIAENLQLKTGGVPVRRDILVQVFIRNN